MTGAEFLGDVIRDLGGLDRDMVFTGGLVLPLYLDRRPTVSLRPTEDADAVVACTTYPQWAALQARLMEIGIQPVSDEPDAPICRMRTPRGYLLDVMPLDPTVLGFGNRWFKQGFEQAICASTKEGLEVKIFPAALYAAAKVEAYRDRGRNDIWASHDLEDFFTLIAYRSSLVSEVAREGEELRAHLAGFAAELLALEPIDEMVDAYLRERVDHVLAVLTTLSQMGQQAST